MRLNEIHPIYVPDVRSLAEDAGARDVSEARHVDDDLQTVGLQDVRTEGVEGTGVVNPVSHHCGPHQWQQALRTLGEGGEAHVSHVPELHLPGVLPPAGEISPHQDTEAADLQHGQPTDHRVGQPHHQGQTTVLLGDDGQAGELDIGRLHVLHDPGQEDTREETDHQDAQQVGHHGEGQGYGGGGVWASFSVANSGDHLESQEEGIVESVNIVPGLVLCLQILLFSKSCVLVGGSLVGLIGPPENDRYHSGEDDLEIKYM